MFNTIIVEYLLRQRNW